MTSRGDVGEGIALKVGEIAPFGPHTPTRLFKLIGEENRDLFLQGRRAESLRHGHWGVRAPTIAES